LIATTILRTRRSRLEAKTDVGATGCYRKCSFTIVNIGEEWLTTERFVCTFDEALWPAQR
jgi:hypothetical protein